MSEPNRTIVLIDDDPVSNLVNQRIIERNFNFEIQTFTRACDALEELKKWAVAEWFPEMILLDIDLPDMDGWDFLESFKKEFDGHNQRRNIAILTSSILVEDIERSKSYEI